MKKCYKCGLIKEHSEFHGNIKAKDGLCTRCKLCDSAYAKEWHQKNKERYNKKAREWQQRDRAENGDKVRLRAKNYRNANKDRIAEWKRRAYAANQTGERARRVLRQYNVTPEQYTELLANQNGCCAVCKCDTPNGRFKKWHLDHDHSCCPGKFSCGKCIRGLLCHKCNVGMGNLSDDYRLLRAAADYLENYEKNTKLPISATL
jgi:hypothetical protein